MISQKIVDKILQNFGSATFIQIIEI